MKFLQTSIFLLALFAINNLQAQKITGKGTYITKTHIVDKFKKLELSGVFSVTLVQGNQNKITIEAQENLHEYIIIDDSGNKLNIHFRKKMNIRKHKKIKVNITFTDFSELETNIVGSIKSEGTLQFNSLKIDNSSVGNLDLHLESKYLDANLSAVGNIYLSGWVKKADINSSIVGKLDASELAVDYLDIDNSSVGSVTVHADLELAIEHSGIGSLYYSGNPIITELSSSGIGKVKQNN